MTKAFLVSLATLFFLLCIRPGLAVGQTVLTFDDLLDDGGHALPTGYAGLSWTGFYYLNAVTNSFNPSGYRNGLVSGSNVAFTNSAISNGSFHNASLFTFNSIYLTGAWSDGLNVEVQGYVGGLSGTRVDDTNVTVNASGPLFFAPNWSGIDTVNFIVSGGTQHPGFAPDNGNGPQVAMDNLSITPVPEPSTIALLTLGGLALIALSKSRKPESA